MLIVTVAGFGTLRLQLAWPFARLAVEPSTTTVSPTNPSAAVDCAVFCSDTSVAS